MCTALFLYNKLSDFDCFNMPIDDKGNFANKILKKDVRKAIKNKDNLYNIGYFFSNEFYNIFHNYYRCEYFKSYKEYYQYPMDDDIFKYADLYASFEKLCNIMNLDFDGMHNAIRYWKNSIDKTLSEGKALNPRDIRFFGIKLWRICVRTFPLKWNNVTVVSYYPDDKFEFDREISKFLKEKAVSMTQPIVPDAKIGLLVQKD